MLHIVNVLNDLYPCRNIPWKGETYQSIFLAGKVIHSTYLGWLQDDRNSMTCSAPFNEITNPSYLNFSPQIIRQLQMSNEFLSEWRVSLEHCNQLAPGDRMDLAMCLDAKTGVSLWNVKALNSAVITTYDVTLTCQITMISKMFKYLLILIF